MIAINQTKNIERLAQIGESHLAGELNRLSGEFKSAVSKLRDYKNGKYSYLPEESQRREAYYWAINSQDRLKTYNEMKQKCLELGADITKTNNIEDEISYLAQLEVSR